MSTYRPYDIDQDLTKVCEYHDSVISTCISCSGMQCNPKYITLHSTNDCMRDLRDLPDEMQDLELNIQLSHCDEDDLFNVEYLKKMLSDLTTKLITKVFKLVIDCNESEDWFILRKKLINFFTNLPLPELAENAVAIIEVGGERVYNDLDFEDKLYMSLKQEAVRSKTVGEKTLLNL